MNEINEHKYELVTERISEYIFSIQHYSLTEEEIEQLIIDTAKLIRYRERLKGDVFYG
jgi:hypothetical protein